MNDCYLLLYNNLLDGMERSYVTMAQLTLGRMVSVIYFDEDGNVCLDSIDDGDIVVLFTQFEENYPAIQPVFDDIRKKHITLTFNFS